MNLPSRSDQSQQGVEKMESLLNGRGESLKSSSGSDEILIGDKTNSDHVIHKTDSNGHLPASMLDSSKEGLPTKRSRNEPDQSTGILSSAMGQLSLIPLGLEGMSSASATMGYPFFGFSQLNYYNSVPAAMSTPGSLGNMNSSLNHPTSHMMHGALNLPGLPLSVSMLDTEHFNQYLAPQYRFGPSISTNDDSSGLSPTTAPSTSPVPITRKKKSPSTSSLSTIAYANAQYTGRFVLLEQPNVRQRKSYKNENRYILPNPLTIMAKDDSNGEKLARITDGTVAVCLVNSEGQELAGKGNLLESPDGTLSQPLDSSCAAHFSLKIGETSEGTLFRLMFTVNFTMEGFGPCEEKLLSRPFQVYSNRKKNSRERPTVIDMKPNQGPVSQETEVWIKGRGFSDRVVVTFGEKAGRLVEASDNLVTVCAPPRFDILSDTSVIVTVANKYPQDMLSADLEKLSFPKI